MWEHSVCLCLVFRCITPRVPPSLWKIEEATLPRSDCCSKIFPSPSHDTSLQTLETPVEAKLPVTDDENYTKTEQAQRTQWLRAALLGASDGLLSTTSLMLGVGAAKVDRWTMILSGKAGAVAGTCSMAVGEFVSVSTQRGIEKTSLLRQSSLKTEMGKKERNEKSNLTISIEPTPSRVIPSGNSPSKPPEQPEKARKITAVDITQVSEGEE